MVRPRRAVRLEPELIAGLEAMARAEHLTLSDIIRRAIREYLERAKRISPTRFRGGR